MALILDGKEVAQSVLERLTQTIDSLRMEGKRIPQLVVIQVGEDPASSVYVRKKKETAEAVGMLSRIIHLPSEVSKSSLLQEIQTLNNDKKVDGILLQLPLPKHIDEMPVLESIRPDKDVDGFHPFNVGRLASGLTPFALPCTPAGVMTMLRYYEIPLTGQHAVIVGRSNIVGKPMAQLLLQAHATVTICHSRTKDLPHHLKQADLVILAVGKPQAFTGDLFKKGVVVVDVGISRLDSGKLVGDADFPSVREIASAITPVPGGVGPMTIATLLENTLHLYAQVLS